MKVIVFGATGTVGKLAVDRMLKDGHDVTAFARHPERLGITTCAGCPPPQAPRAI